MFFDHELGKAEAAWIRLPKRIGLLAKEREVSQLLQE
jgi:hypothetical protein